MARVSCFFLASFLAATVAIPQLGGSALFPCPPPRQEAPICKNFCKAEAPGTVGKYYCCDEDNSPDNNPGSCPRITLQPQEIDIMCDLNDPNRPFSLNCKRDADCHPWEKCCYTPFTQQLICRQAIYT